MNMIIPALALLLGAASPDTCVHMMNAVRDGDADKVQSLIDEGADVNCTVPPFGYSPLMWAASEGQTRIASVLIANKADIGYRNANGSCAFLIACEKGNAAIMEMLLQGKVDINRANSDGNTGLMLASRRGYADIVTKLIALKADVNLRNRTGWSALMEASAEGRTEIMQQLISAKSQIGIRDAIGNSCLMWASMNNRIDAVRLLLANGADVNAANERRLTPYKVAEAKGYKEIADTLRKAGGK